VSIGSVLDTNGDPARIGDPANNAARVICVAGSCGGAGGTQDVNLLEFLGLTPSATNPIPHRLSTGTVFYDARDRNWTLNSGTDSITVGNAFLLDATFTARINTLGQKTMANSTPVVLPSDQSAIPVTPSAITMSLTVTGQQAVTGSAVALPSNTAKEVCIRALSSGTQTVFYGPSGVTTATGQELLPGDKHCAPVSNSNQFFVIAGGVGTTLAFEVYN
jgi:hypothetical protein